MGSDFTSSQIIEKVTGIKIDKIKGKSKNRRISNIRKLYIKSLKRYTGLLNKEIAALLKIGSSTVTNVLSGRYNEVIKYRNSLDRLAHLRDQIVHKGINVSKKDCRSLIDDAFKFVSEYSNKFFSIIFLFKIIPNKLLDC